MPPYKPYVSAGWDCGVGSTWCVVAKASGGGGRMGTRPGQRLTDHGLSWNSVHRIRTSLRSLLVLSVFRKFLGPVSYHTNAVGRFPVATSNHEEPTVDADVIRGRHVIFDE